MGIKQYHEEELTPDWVRARQASIKYGELRNHRVSTKKNDHRISLWVACDFIDMGVKSAEAITDTDWLNLVERYRAGQTRSGNPLTEGSIRKRKEGLVQILKAMKLSDILHFVEMWKEKKEAKDVTYWNFDEMEAMNRHAFQMSVEPKQLKFAVVHFLHYYIAPRRQDSAKFKWKCIDLLSGITQFNASKNEKRCVAIISEVHLTVFRKYKAWLEEQGHDMTYLFPSSNAGNSGTTKVKQPHVSDKSINSWLAKVRKGAEPYYGQTIRPYASHTYRHTLAMRMLDNGVSYENIARILGDTVATIEAHYSELVMTRDFRKAMETVYGGSDVKTTEGTAQPEWLDRFRKVRTSNLHKPLMPHSRGTDSKLVADVPGFEPGFSA